MKRSRSSQTAGPYALRYLSIDPSHTHRRNFPVLGPYKCILEPDSHPIDHLHVHELLEVGYCHSGAGIFVVGDRVMTFEAGDTAVINDQEMHMARGYQQSPSQWAYFWMDPAATLAGIPDALEVFDQTSLAGPHFPNVISCRAHPDLCQVVYRILCELEQPQPHSRVMIRGLAAVLMAGLHRLCPEPASTRVPAIRTTAERIAPALQHMVNHYHEELEVEELADLCFMSVTHFRRLFLAATGQTPLEYLAQVRIRMAAAQLREQPDRPITQVAAAVGFDALNTFNRQFRRIIGVNPRQWRRQRANRPSPVVGEP